jgi:fatty acid desaturase
MEALYFSQMLRWVNLILAVAIAATALWFMARPLPGPAYWMTGAWLLMLVGLLLFFVFVLTRNPDHCSSARIDSESNRMVCLTSPSPVTDSIHLPGQCLHGSLGEDDTLDSLLQRADRALYVAKDKGPNRVEVAD